MVIGNGLIANTFSQFKKSKEFLIFASGVSNSLETDLDAFNREFELLKDAISAFPNYKFIYFSTCSIEDSSVNQRPYVKHKLKIETYIKNHASKYYIFRISNAIGDSKNKHTILNYLVDAISNKKPIEIWAKADRNLIDKDDIKSIVIDLINNSTNNKTVNIAVRKSLNMLTLLNSVELFLNKKAIATTLSIGEPFNIDTSKISKLLEQIEIEKGVGITYVDYLLYKYY